MEAGCETVVGDPVARLEAGVVGDAAVNEEEWNELSQPMQTYYRQKWQLMWDILERNMPVILDRAHDVYEGDEPFCQNCRKRFGQVQQLHIEHPNGDGNQQRLENGEKPDGWKNLKRYRKQFEEGKTLWVVCDVCHYLLHRMREDGHASKLMRGRPWIEKYEEVDPEFELKKRNREGGSIYGEV